LPNRQQRAAGYGVDGQSALEWAGDSAQPGQQPVPAVSIPPGQPSAPPPSGSSDHDYDDGFGPMPPPTTTVTPSPVPARSNGEPKLTTPQSYGGAQELGASSRPYTKPFLVEPYDQWSSWWDALTTQLGHFARGAMWFLGVTDTTHPPYSAICQVRRPDGTAEGAHSGTAFFIAPRLLLTAAHVVDGESELIIVPGKNGTGGGSEPFGRFNVTQFQKHGSYGVNGRDNDMALICVPAANAASAPNYFDLVEELTQSRPEGVVVSGYAAWWYVTSAIEEFVNNNIDENRQHAHGGYIRELPTDGTFSYDLQTLAGTSGSPVYWIEDGAQPRAHLVGVHVAAHDNTTNLGCRITQEKLGWIRATAAAWGQTLTFSLGLARGLEDAGAFVAGQDDPDAIGIREDEPVDAALAATAQSIRARAFDAPLPDYPDASRFVPAHANNFTPRRRSDRVVDRIVIHITAGGSSINGTIAWFQNGNRVNERTGKPIRSSAHYIVGRDGEVVQMVRNAHTAHHASAANSRSIGIEHNANKPSRGNPRDLPPTEPQYEASSRLVAWLCQQYNLPIDREHIVGHQEISPGDDHDCPSSIWNWDHYMDLVRAAASGSGAQAFSASQRAWARAQDAQDALKNEITQIAGASDIARYSWQDRGIAPAGYIKGMALVYARVYSKLKAGDAAALEMAKAKTADSDRDALTWYDDIFAAAGMSNDTEGVDTLRHLFVLLIGLGMRESSGKYCEGRDQSAQNTTAETAEAGLFQTSFNARHANSLLPTLFAQYSANPSGFLDVFQEGVRCSASNLENFGSGDGREFQRLSKECPAFAAEFAAVGLRNIRKHWGPINRRAAEVRPECDALLRQVEACVDAAGLSEALSARAEGDRQKPVSRALVVGLEDRQKARKYGPPFQKLFQWPVPTSVVRAIEARGFKVQTIDAAVGDLNLDRYPVAITRFPEGWDASRLLQHFIRNINQFVDTDLTEFIPYDESDAQRLASSNPTSTVFKLDIAGPDNAAIVISAAEPQFYIVSTINTPWSGDHPVSGHRQFGYIVEDGKITFYTRGADRATLGFPGTESAIFYGAEKLWESLQSKLAAFINDNGGMAEIIPPFSERFNATAMREEFGRFDVAQSLAAARAVSTDAFTVNWDEIELVPQPTDVSCWATAAAMVVGWRDRVSLSPETIAQIAGRTIATGLNPAQVEQFAREIGLVFEYPACYTVEGFRQLLETKGPLWVGAAVPSLHVIVVTGLYQDANDTFVRITDPWDRQVGSPGAPGSYLNTHSTGSRYIMRWEDFVREYETAPMTYSGVNLQILHSGSASGRVANYGFPSPPLGYAQGQAARTAAARPTHFPPPPRARSFDAPEISPVQAATRRVRGGTAGVSWELDQYDGMKAPAGMAVTGAHVPTAGSTINLSDWPYIDGPTQRTYAAVIIDWTHQGGMVGDVRIEIPVSMAYDEYTLKVTADITDGPDTATIAALRITVRHEFNRPGAPNQAAVTEVTLYGDGRYERQNRWELPAQAAAA